jgi:hypothetical protein
MVPVLYTTRSNIDNVCATFSTIAWSGGKIVIKEGSGAVVGTGAAEANGIHVQPVFQDSTTIVFEFSTVRV